MARTDDDTWDLASSVGATATAVAAARAMASKTDPPLIDDPFAEPLVNAVGISFFSKLVSGELTAADLGDDGVMTSNRMIHGMVVRTRFFDEFFGDAAAAGIRQMVILASGLDARAYRLPWPAGTTVYELDQPQVIEFKRTTLAEFGAQPSAEHRTIAIDLRNDWPAALRAAGFDPAQPSAWIAEGLLGYLPPDAQDRLLDDITALSARGSRLATQSVVNLSRVDQEQIRERMQGLSERWRPHGFDLDMTELVYFGERNEVGMYLAERGWEIEGTPTSELFVKYGLEPPAEPDLMFGDIVNISATLN